MKTKLLISKWIVSMILLFCATNSWAQVGELTKTGNISVCQNSTAPFGVIATNGSVYTWEIIAGTGGGGTIIDGPAPNNLISVVWTGAGTCTLQVTETSASCTGVPVSIEVTVLPGIMPGTASADQTICFGTAPSLLTATAPTGEQEPYIYQWESSSDGGASWTLIAGAEALTYQPEQLTQTTHYRLQQSSAGGCGIVTTNQVTVTVQPQVLTSPIYHK